MVREVGRPGVMLDRIHSECKLRGVDAISGDGYFVRTLDGKRIGPMSEREFSIVRSTDDVLRVASAWRESGGAIFKVQLTQRVRVRRGLRGGRRGDDEELRRGLRPHRAH